MRFICSGLVLLAILLIPAGAHCIDTLNLDLVAEIPIPDNICRIIYDDDHLYFTGTSSGYLYVVDITDRYAPAIEGFCDAASNLCPISKYDCYIIGNDEIELFLIDCTNPTSPAHRATYGFGGPTFLTNQKMVGQYLFVTEMFSGLLVIDFGDPFTADVIGSYSDIFNANNLDATTNYVYVGGIGDVHILSFVPPDFELMGTYSYPMGLNQIKVFEPYCFISSAAAVLILDVSDVTSPTLVGEYEFTTSASYYDLELYDSLLFVSSSYGIEVLNIHNLDSIYCIYSIPGTISSSFLVVDSFLVLGSEGNLCIYEINPVTGIPEKPGKPYEFYLSQNSPNPFNSNTVLEYSLENPANVTISIFDLKGRLVEKTINNHHPAGVHRLQLDLSNEESGIFIVAMNCGSTKLVRKITHIK